VIQPATNPLHRERESPVGDTVDMRNGSEHAGSQNLTEYTSEKPQTCHSAFNQNQANHADTAAGMDLITNAWETPLAGFNDQEVDVEYLAMLDFERILHTS
jgi:hypothetical protein